MVYRFLILSDEVANFKREIQISSEATFLDLHHAIIDATLFIHNEISSFFICNDDWNKKTEITLVDMGASPDADIYLMEETALEELLTDENQRLLYVFDYLTERALFMELSEIITGKALDKPICSLSVGQPPVQSLSFEDIDNRVERLELEEDFYGDSDFNDDELDSLDAGDYGDESIDNIFDDDRF
jgi:Plasmid pRiA4b ORF-3-like protein.